MVDDADAAEKAEPSFGETVHAVVYAVGANVAGQFEALASRVLGVAVSECASIGLAPAVSSMATTIWLLPQLLEAKSVVAGKALW